MLALTRWWGAMSTATRCWCVALALVVLLGLLPGTVRMPTVIRMEGSTTIGLDLAPVLAEAYLRSVEASDPVTVRNGNTTTVEATLPGEWRPTRFEIRARGTDTAFEPDDSEVDIGMASRQVTEDEQDMLDRGALRNSTVAEKPIAVDGIGIIVHRDIAVPTLAAGQVTDIFTCPDSADNWAEIPGSGSAEPIRVGATGTESGSFDVFGDYFLPGGRPLCPEVTVFRTGAELAEWVERTPGAVGFVALPLIGDDVRAVPLYADDSGATASTRFTVPTAPTRFTVSTESYLVSRRLYLYLFPEPEPEPVAAAFVEFASNQGRDVIDDKGFVAIGFTYPPDPGAADPAQQMPTPGPPPVPVLPACTDPAEYPAFVEGAVRRSTDLRFASGDTQLDTRAVVDADILVAELRDPAAAGREILLVGFADAAGTPEVNLELSRVRAAVVEDVLRRGDIRSVSSAWFGEACPVEPNSSEFAMQRNRRVEVWIRYPPAR